LAQLQLVRIWHILFFSFCTGLTQAVAWPVYQAVMGNIVPRRNLPNAIALNSVQFNLARTIGPLLGALGLHWFGMAGCFYPNGLSFLAVIAAVSRVTIPAPET
jgi:MFS family permease